MCGSLGVNFRQPSGDVDERVKAFLGSAAMVYQQQHGDVCGRRSSADSIWLEPCRFLFGRGRRRVAAPIRRTLPFTFSRLGPLVGDEPFVQCSLSKVSYEDAPRRIARAARIDRG